MNRVTFKKHRFAFLLAVLLCTTVVVTCCTSAPVKPETGYPSDLGEKAAKTAISMIGRPYKFRGDSPSGFDCSGLVRYSYLAAGLEVPHGTTALKKITHPVGKNVQIGDLLFFSERGKKYSHVGIFIGGELFVHAPSSGQKVRKDSLKDPYWKQTYIEARRL